MDLFQAIILGTVQGLTEFLPVSSSGHLVIFQHIFGLKDPELFFDISVHVGTLVAIIIFFRGEIKSIIASLINLTVLAFKRKVSFRDIYKDKHAKLAILIVIGSVPTAVIGLLFNRIADKLFSSVVIVGFMLIITGLILWGTRWVKNDSKTIADFSLKNALFIGFIQGMAIIPGISRSGSTIAAALFSGINRETAARYSFLLSIPAIAGASAISMNNLSGQTLIPLKITLIGALTSCIVGYGALKLLIKIVKHGHLYMFAPYCWIIGILALIL